MRRLIPLVRFDCGASSWLAYHQKSEGTKISLSILGCLETGLGSKILKSSVHVCFFFNTTWHCLSMVHKLLKSATADFGTYVFSCLQMATGLRHEVFHAK